MDANNTEPGASAGFVQQAVLIGVGTPILGLPHQGSAVALSADGNTALIGGPGQLYETGAAYVFTRSNGAWQQEQVLIGLPSFVLSQERKGAIVAPIGLEYGGNQGYAVALSADGNTAFVGGPCDYNNKGMTWLFYRTNGVWRRGERMPGEIPRMITNKEQVCPSRCPPTVHAGSSSHPASGRRAALHGPSRRCMGSQGRNLALPISTPLRRASRYPATATP